MFFCIRSVNFSVLVNGYPIEFFRSLRGLRQGDPLSPFLFLMVSKVFSKMIRKAELGYILSFFWLVLVGVWHLQFMDDTMIFLCGYETVGFFRCILSYFEVVSSPNIDLAKSELF